MLTYLLRRAIAAVFVLIGVSIVIFLIAHAIPGDPARIALGPQATEEAVAAQRAQMHLDSPLVVQYVEFARLALRGDFGISLFSRRPVIDDIRQYLPATVELVLASALVMVCVGIPLGVLGGHFRDRWPDHAARITALLGVVAPSFVWAILLVLVFAYWFDVFPVIGRLDDATIAPPRATGFLTVDALLAGDWAALRDAVWHLALPATALALSGIGQAARLTRANLVQSYQRDYIGLARAYGFSGRSIAWKYALRPAMIPTLTILGLDFAAKLGNAFLVETVFAWPGVARYGVSAILNKDLNAIVATVLVIGCGFVVVNLVIDVVVALLDPRIRARGDLMARLRQFRRFARNPLSVVGLFFVVLIVAGALFAPWVTPYPTHAGGFVDMEHAGEPPSLAHPFGTDTVGRDLLTRTVFAYRLSLALGVVVLALATPIGVALGLLAGYSGGWRETVVMRVTDIFLSLPPLVLALAIVGFLSPNLTNAMIAVSVTWWPWYTRLAYNMSRQVATEGYVGAAEVIGASAAHILLREILPNCAGPILTKMTLDLGFVILIGSSLSFLGLGVQPPTPDLGSMVAEGARYLPDMWWLSVFPGLSILIAVLGFNLAGDGVNDLVGGA